MPLAEGPVRDRVCDAGNAIADALLAYPPAGADAAPALNGTLGAVLFLAEWGAATGERSYATAADALLDEAIGTASLIDPPTIGLYGVPLGVAWVDAILRPDDEDSDVDVFVGNVVDRDVWPGAHDLLHGLAGVGAYCLARLPRPGARRAVERVVDHLASSAREEPDGLTWPYVPAPGGAFVFNEHQPQGHVNVGFAHGVAGILAFLAGAVEAGVTAAREPLEQAVRWFVAQRLPPGRGSAFPAYVVAGVAPEPARLAWCYGDPGAAVALLAAGTALGDDGVVALARDVALGCAGRDGGDDATLCHGSAGLAHIFNRLSQSLGDEQLRELALHWLTLTLDRHGAGLTEVDRRRLETQNAAHPDSDVPVDAGYGLLFGAAGVGLALASAVSNRPPQWDAPMFLTPTSEAVGAQ